MDTSAPYPTKLDGGIDRRVGNLILHLAGGQPTEASSTVSVSAGLGRGAGGQNNTKALQPDYRTRSSGPLCRSVHVWKLIRDGSPSVGAGTAAGTLHCFLESISEAFVVKLRHVLHTMLDCQFLL
jgi:hypothetical protein